MKKHLFLLLSIFLGLNAFADGESCLINGATDGSSLLIVSSQKVGNFIEVTVANDSQSTAANVTITVTSNYKYESRAKTETTSSAGLAMPSATTIIKVPVKEKIGDYKFVDYQLSLKSSKCQ